MDRLISLHSFEHRMMNEGNLTCFVRPYDFLPEYKIGQTLNFGGERFKVKSREYVGDVFNLGLNNCAKLKALGFVKDPSKATAHRFTNWWRQAGYADISYSAYFYGVERI